MSWPRGDSIWRAPASERGAWTVSAFAVRMLSCSLAFATSGGHDAVWASTVAVANVAIAEALIKPASTLFISSLPVGYTWVDWRDPYGPPPGLVSAELLLGYE